MVNKLSCVLTSFTWVGADPPYCTRVLAHSPPHVPYCKCEILCNEATACFYVDVQHSTLRLVCLQTQIYKVVWYLLIISSYAWLLLLQLWNTARSLYGFKFKGNVSLQFVASNFIVLWNFITSSRASSCFTRVIKCVSWRCWTTCMHRDCNETDESITSW